jgi:hypothetical protein
MIATITVPFDVVWWHIALMVICGGAITVWGLHGMTREWLACEENRVIIIMMDIAALVVCIVAGTLVGWRVWDPVMCGVLGLLGGIGYKLFMKLINKFLKKRGLNGNGH